MSRYQFYSYKPDGDVKAYLEFEIKNDDSDNDLLMHISGGDLFPLASVLELTAKAIREMNNE